MRGLLALSLLLACVPAAAEPAPDALDEALAAAGLTRHDLGWD